MFSVRCTKKLLDRMRADPEPNPPRPTTILGDWYANLLRVGKHQLILCVSEKTLLPVLLPAVDAKCLPQRLPHAVAEMLHAIKITPGNIDRELAEMSLAAVAKTASRTVLGTMNDFAWMMEVSQDRSESLLSTALFLAQSPCSPIKMSFPDRATKAAFAESLH